MVSPLEDEVVIRAEGTEILGVESMPGKASTTRPCMGHDGHGRVAEAKGVQCRAMAVLLRWWPWVSSDDRIQMCLPLSGVPSVKERGVGVAPRTVGGRVTSLELPRWFVSCGEWVFLPAGDTCDCESRSSEQPLRTPPQPGFSALLEGTRQKQPLLSGTQNSNACDLDVQEGPRDL